MRYVGFVRNVMVGREGLHRQVLLDLLKAAGGAQGASHLATGNLTFDVAPRLLPAVVRRLEGALADVIGRSEPVVTRPLTTVQRLVDEHPFGSLDVTDWDVSVTLIKESEAPLTCEVARDALPDDRVDIAGHELFVATPRTALPPVWVTRAVQNATGVKATTRAWSTMKRIATHG